MASSKTAGLIHYLFDPLTEIEGARILEVGSPTWPWESIRERFHGCREFISVDLQQRVQTDFICNAENLVEFFGAETFELVISLFTIEHVENWKAAVSNFKNVCTPGGIIFIATCTQHFPYHDSFDAWRFEIQDIQEIFNDCHLEFIAVFPPDSEHTPGNIVFAKVRKPLDFMERDLSAFPLFNINYGQRV